MPEVVNAGDLPGIGLAMVPSFGIKKHKDARNLVVVPEAQPGADSAPRYIFIPILDEVSEQGLFQSPVASVVQGSGSAAAVHPEVLAFPHLPGVLGVQKVHQRLLRAQGFGKAEVEIEHARGVDVGLEDLEHHLRLGEVAPEEALRVEILLPQGIESGVPPGGIRLEGAAPVPLFRAGVVFAGGIQNAHIGSGSIELDVKAP